MAFYGIDRERRVITYAAISEDAAKREVLQTLGGLKDVRSLAPQLVDQLFASLVKNGVASIHETDVEQSINKPLKTRF